MEVRVIGFCGAARSGKDTAAEYFIDHIYDQCDEYLPKTFSMASTLKHMLAELYIDLGVDWFEEPPKEEPLPGLDASPRKLMQTLGTDWARDMIDKDIWITVMKARINTWTKALNLSREAWSIPDEADPTPLIVIPDIRYNNEAGKLCDYVVQVRRTGAKEVRKHKSEAGISPHLIDFTIFNDASLEALDNAVSNLVEELLNGEQAEWTPKSIT